MEGFERFVAVRLSAADPDREGSAVGTNGIAAAAVAVGLVLLVSCTATQTRTEPPPEEPTLTSRAECTDLARLVERTRRGYVPVRSPDVIPIPAEPHYIGQADLPVHTGPWDYLAEVPLVFHGPGLIRSGSTDARVTLADLAPTTGALIGHRFQAPDGKARPLPSRRPPKLVVTIVWDGAGWNTLREHPRSWPFLRRAMEDGYSFDNATIGSTPSNTPPIHTTIGTGAFPSTHGISHVKIRLASGDYVDPFEGDDASFVRVPTLGDVYDRARGNEPEVGVVATVNWHLGMIGHGAEHPGGDRDIAVLLNDQGKAYGNSNLYEVAERGDPTALQTATQQLDAGDGEIDQRWGPEDLSDPAIRYATPAFTAYQQSVLEDTIRAEGFGADDVPDLMYVNFKQIDDAGHRWGMTSEQVADNITAADDALQRLSTFLDRSIGKGQWVVVVTADHGQTPYPEQSGAWPIRGSELKADIERQFADEIDVLRVTSGGVFLKDAAAVRDGRAEEVARWLGDYAVADNVPRGDQLPRAWKGRGQTRLFTAVMAGPKVVSSACPR